MSATTAILSFDDIMVQNWLRSYIRKSINMFPSWITADDLQSEAWIIFNNTVERYASTASNRRHLMSLFMVVAERAFYQMAKSTKNKTREETLTSLLGEGEYNDDSVFGVAESESMLDAIVRTPAEVRDTISSLMRFPETLGESSHTTASGKTRRHDMNGVVARARNKNGIYTKMATHHADELRDYLRSNT